MWVESVPNFSNGTDRALLERLIRAARRSGATVMGAEQDEDHNRAVLSLAGSGEQVLDALMATAEVAVREIDLRGQRGIHPRIGAIDVVPIIPLGDTPMTYAAQLADQLGKRLGQELGLPVFLYEHSATRPSRKNLADVRRGGFEGLARRMVHDVPDYGPSNPHPSAGAVAVGARWALVAFNCYLSTEDLEVARAIAQSVRQSSGGLVGIKALGLYLARQRAVQVSMNLVDYPTTTLAEALERVRAEAGRRNVRVVRHELIGLMPLRVLFEAAERYLQLPGLGLDKVVELNLARSAIEQVMVPPPGEV